MRLLFCVFFLLVFFWEGLASYLNRKTGGLAQRPFLSAASGSLPLAELSSLHAQFGGDDSATRAETWKTHGTPEGICLCGGSLVDGSEFQISNLNEYVYIYNIHQNGSFSMSTGEQDF